MFALWCMDAHAQQVVIPGDLLVMPKPGVPVEAIVQDLAKVDGKVTGLHVVRQVSVPMRTWLLHFDARDIGQDRMLYRLRMHPGVELAQNNHHVTFRAVPNDTQYADQWQHQNINSEGAWDITTGGLSATGDTIVVCIVENCDLPHPDLIGNAWHNYHEVPNNDIDDDGNGYVDDFLGWNATSDSDNVYGGPHGTEVAGMVGAKGNNGSQVVGANWNVKLMPVQNVGADDAGVIASYSYPLVMRRMYNATQGAQGAFVVVTNASWGVDGGQSADAPLWCAMYDTLGTAGILNCGATANQDVDIDQVGDLPTACPSDLLISVTATDIDDQRTFSGYGLHTIDVGAPGDNVFTTALGGGTTFTSGTSFASPLTAGVVALLYSVPCPDLMALVHADPRAGALYVRQALFSGVEQVGNLPGHTVTGGRINASNSAHWLMEHCIGCVTPFNLHVEDLDSTVVALHWSTVDPAPANVRYRPVGEVDWTTVSVASGTLLEVDSLMGCHGYEFQVQADCGDVQSAFTPWYAWTTDGCCVAPAPIQVTRTAPTTIEVEWPHVLAATAYDLRYRQVGTATWTEMDNAGGSPVTLNGLQACTEYEFQLRSDCAHGPADWSPSEVRRTADCEQCQSDAFCPSVGGDASSEWIQRITVGGVDNNSGNDGGYGSFTADSAHVVIGVPTPILLQPGYSNTAYGEYFTVWMDLDRDGQFTPAEKIFDPGHVVHGALDTVFTVPANTAPGAIRMRVIMHYDEPVPSGCADGYDFGETEDYCLALLPGPDGIEEQALANTINVYPVPADEQVTVVLGATVNGTVEVFDAAGRTRAMAALRGGTATLPTSAWSNGAYIYRISDHGRTVGRGVFVVAH